MAKNINKDVVYKAAKSKEKDYIINDGEGLYFFVGKNGARLWRFVYTFNKKQKKLALGVYPGVTLEAARPKQKKQAKILPTVLIQAKSESKESRTHKLTLRTQSVKRMAYLSLTV